MLLEDYKYKFPIKLMTSRQCKLGFQEADKKNKKNNSHNVGGVCHKAVN